MPKPRIPSRDHAKDAFRLANDLMLDLLTGMRAYDTFQGFLAKTPAREPVPTGILRLCLGFLVLSLAKWTELYDRYKAVIPTDVGPAAKDLRSEVTERGVVEFRNKVVGHVWDDDTGRPLTSEEVQARVHEIIRGDIQSFMLWINNPGGNVFPTTVVSVIERLRDRLAEEHRFSSGDL